MIDFCADTFSFAKFAPTAIASITLWLMIASAVAIAVLSNSGLTPSANPARKECLEGNVIMCTYYTCY